MPRPLRPLTDAEFTLLVPLAAGCIDLAGSARAYAPLLRRHLVECRRPGLYTATDAGKALVRQQITRLIVIRTTRIWPGLRPVA